MKTLSLTAMAIVAAALFTSTAHAQPANSASLAIEGGTVTFDAGTNLSAISVHGKSSKLKGRVDLQRQDAGFLLENVEAWLPVKELSTGMGLRDDHMRQHIFKTSDGQFPDIRFKAENVVCRGDASRETTCNVPGRLSIQGRERDFAVTLKIRSDGSSARNYRAVGEGIIKLSDYGIERPSQMGVKVEDAIKLHLEFSGKEVAQSASGGTNR